MRIRVIKRRSRSGVAVKRKMAPMACCSSLATRHYRPDSWPSAARRKMPDLNGVEVMA